MTIGEVEKLTGLTAAEVADRVARGQANTLPPRSGRTVGDIVRANLFTRINAILAVLLAMVLVTGSWINGTFGFLIIANSIIGIFQELRAKRTLDSLAVVGESRPRVRRDGVTVEVSRDEIVLDDLIEMGPGDQVVVDGEVVAADYLEVDESLLTGESDPEAKTVGSPVMSGSFVVSGAGTYRATQVGGDSYAAQLTAQASKFSLVHSELNQGINRILRIITWVLIPVGVATIWVQSTQAHNDWRKSILAMAGALVPMVPEGLVLLTSVAFALGVVRLGRQQCLVQELPAIEGLARVDIVCADKTGTLTENGLRFGRLEPLNADADEARAVLAQLCAADPRPNASLQAIAVAVPGVGDPWPVTARAPFTSAKKWSGASFEGKGSWVLGAPDVLADPASADARRAEEIGMQGLRVLLLGRAELPVDHPDAPGRVTPVALVVLEQRVRPDAKDTLAYFAEQHVAVKVISGDNAASVGAVTRGLGVVSGEAVDARTLPEGEQAFADEVVGNSVFGRVTPLQKRQMVGALQSRGHTVAMTGDGVNDVLALKDADLGVAMGSGSAATRAVAKVVLLDDRFATLPLVVAEGRRVIGNIERVANLFLTKTIYSVVLALLVVLWRLPFPYLPIHVTLISWFTIGIPAFALSLPPNNERARPGFVARVMRFVVPAGLVVGLATFTTYLLLRSNPSLAPGSESAIVTATLITTIVVASWVLAVVARPYVAWKYALLAVSFGMYVFIFSWEVTRGLFFLDVSSADVLAVGLLSGIAGAVAIELLWRFNRRTPRRRASRRPAVSHG